MIIKDRILSDSFEVGEIADFAEIRSDANVHLAT